MSKAGQHVHKVMLSGNGLKTIHRRLFAIHCRTRTALTALAKTLYEIHKFDCRYEKPSFGDLIQLRRKIGDVKFSELYGLNFTDDEWNIILRLNDASRRVLHNSRLHRTHSGAEFTIFHLLPEYTVEDQIRIMENIIRKIETVPGAEARVISDEIEKNKK